MRAALVLLLLLAAPVAATGPRVVVENYIAGAGDFLCFPGAACASFSMEGGETSVALDIVESRGWGISFNVCTLDCNDYLGPYCDSAVVPGVPSGGAITVFLHNIPDACGIGVGVESGGPPVSGTVTATFT